MKKTIDYIAKHAVLQMSDDYDDTDIVRLSESFKNLHCSGI